MTDDATTTSTNQLQPGDPAPDFAVTDQYKIDHRLRDYRGKSVLLYFYPEDDTSG